MSASLLVTDNFSVTAQGTEYSGKQGASTGAFDDAFTITVSGQVFDVLGSLATATAVAAWTSSLALATWAYLWLWADQDLYVQLIGSATNGVFKVLAKTPFTLSYQKVLAAANTTPISTTEPAVTTVASVYLGNYSGSTANYQLSLVY